MNSVEAALSSWRKLILSNEFELPYEQLKSDIANKKWTSEEEPHIATYCLVAVNMKAYESLKSDFQDNHYIQKMFKLSELCCSVVEKTWKCKGANFLGSIYNICRYFLSQNHIYEALVVSQYAMEYVEKRNMDSLIEEELRSIKALLCLHLKYLSCTELTVGNSEVMFDVWKFVLSSQGINVKDSCADRILDSFQCFCNKAGSLVEHHKSSLVLVMYLKDIYFTNFTDSSFSYFITICRILINHSSSGETKKIILTIIECIDNFRASKTTVQNLFCKFCCQILRFSVCYVDSTETNLVDECVQQLQSISSLPPLLLNHAVYFASVILMHSRNCWFNEDSFFYKNCIISVFKLLLTLANEMKMVNMNQLSGTKNGSGRDHFFPICLANLVLSITYRISDWDTMTLKDSFPYVKQAAQISSTIYDENCEIDDKRKLQLYYLIAGSCVNVCRIYIKAELYEESRQISMIAAQKIAILSSSQLSDSSLQSCVEKLILCLFNSFKYLNLYEDALRTACNWAFKLPNAEKVFMELFASLKAKIFSSETKDYLNITSWDLLIKDKQRNQSIWSNINFKNLKILPLLKAELRQYAAHSVKSAPLIQKIINIVSEKEDIIMKIEFYVWSGIVLTLSNDCLKAATKLLPPIDSFIQEIQKKNKLKNTEEQSILYSYSLGNLYYTKFRINLLNARCGSEQEVILTDKIRAPRSILELGMEQEPEDVTDIINNYLTYESQQNIMSWLDSAINHWNDVVIKLKNVKSGEKYFDLTNEGSSLIIFIREAAFLYRLYCHESKEANAWKLLHSLAIICDNNEVATFAFSNLLSTRDDCDLKWKTEAESKLASLTPSIRIRYRLETANKLLKSGNASEGVALLSGINENDMKNDAILCAKYYFIVSQYECAGFLVPKHYAANTAFRAYCKLVSWIKNGCWGTFWESCEAQSLLFDVALFIGNSYRESYLINDAKSYLQEQVYLIQKLCLPLRISQFLIALCQVSYITCNVEDYYGKLTALKSVLKYGDKNQKNNRIVESCSKASLAVSPILSMNSDVRFVSTNASDDILSSPVFESGLKFDTPDFVYHESTCICAVCEDTRYQLISCEVMCLFGPYFYRAGKCGKALHHFKTALEMLDILQNRLKPIHSSKNMDILRLKIVTKIRHSDFWAWCRDFEKAKVFHREATVDNSHLIVPDQAIVRELKDQYWALNAIEVDILVKEEVIPKKKATRLKATLPTVIQTPASKKSVAIFEDDDEDSKAAELIKKMTITPHPKRSRRLLFKKDEPSFVTPIKPPPSSSRNTRLNKKPEHTPPDFVMQTPSSARRTTRTAKKDVGEIASVVTSTKLRSRKK